MSTTYVVGDLHGDFSVIDKVLNNSTLLEPGDTVIQLGDFGFTTRKLHLWNEMFPMGLPHRVPLLVIDGNHEDFSCGINPDVAELQEMAHNLWYVPRGYVMDIGGLAYGFMGGACSVDKVYQGSHWDAREAITAEQASRLYYDKIDVLITHSPGTSLTLKHFGPLNKESWGLPPEWMDVSAPRVENLINRLNPKLVVSGHMHRHIRDELFGIRQWVLDINEIDVIPNNL